MGRFPPERWTEPADGPRLCRRPAAGRISVEVNLEWADLECTTIWSALAERSGDGAFVDSVPPADSKAASRFACRRTPYILRMEALGGTAKFRPRWLASFLP